MAMVMLCAGDWWALVGVSSSSSPLGPHQIRLLGARMWQAHRLHAREVEAHPYL